MILPIILSVVSVASAQHMVAGVGRLSLGVNTPGASASANVDVEFNSNVLSSAIGSIVSSLTEGPNRTSSSVLPVSKVYGVSYGGWLISEPWMNPSEWLSMGGEFCDSCADCRSSEWSLATYLGQNSTNAVFKQHWETWLTEDDVDEIAAAGLNTVRIPVPFWIVEEIVDRSHEPYAQGGLDELIRGLTLFKEKGINVLLDHHALPGVAASEQMFAGNCTTDVQFYDSEDDYNYKRAVTWSIVMAYLAHTHPAFETVFSIEAANEVLQDATQTPGLAGFYNAFVRGIRAIESAMGITCDDTLDLGILTDSIALPALVDAIPIIAKYSQKYNIGPLDSFDWNTLSNITSLDLGALLSAFLGSSSRQRQCLTTIMMNEGWQWNNPVNPADSAIGPQAYDNHLYFNFGGVAPEVTEDSYMVTMCNTTRVADAAAIGNAPLIGGEWSLAVAFNTTNDFLKKWGDAQKLYWAQGAGWIFWTWKVNSDVQSWPIYYQQNQWSYKNALADGIFTQDPSAAWDADVCVPYLAGNTTSSNVTTTSAASTSTAATSTLSANMTSSTLTSTIATSTIVLSNTTTRIASA